jgi:hypothetical protein
MIEAVHTSETSINFNVTTRRYIPEGYVNFKIIALYFEKDMLEKFRVNTVTTGSNRVKPEILKHIRIIHYIQIK